MFFMTNEKIFRWEDGNWAGVPQQVDLPEKK